MTKLCNLCAGLAGIIMMLMIGHILLEIFLRSFLDSSTYVLDEFVGYGVAAMTFLALPKAAMTDSLIKVSLIDTVVYRPMPRRVLSLIRTSATLLICGGLAFYIGRSVVRNFDRGRVSETIAEVPLWLPEVMVLTGLLVFLMVLIVKIFTLVVTKG